MLSHATRSAVLTTKDSINFRADACHDSGSTSGFVTSGSRNSAIHGLRETKLSTRAIRWRWNGLLTEWTTSTSFRKIVRSAVTKVVTIPRDGDVGNVWVSWFHSSSASKRSLVSNFSVRPPPPPSFSNNRLVLIGEKLPTPLDECYDV